MQFPRDHGAHAGYRIEWWYLTANLKGPDGQDYGAQWTLFRSALAPHDGEGWSTPQLWMGNAAVTTKTEHFLAERMARGGIGQAGVTLDPFRAWIDDWQISSETVAGTDEIAKIKVSASGPAFSYDLSLNARNPLVLQGDKGYSVKSASGQASYYYSQPSYSVSGVLHLRQGDIEVTGDAWYDHEWSSQPLSSDQIGWDWFSLHFDSGEKLMGFRLRDSGAGFSSGTWINSNGNPETLPPHAFKITPLETMVIEGRTIPTRWRVVIGQKGVDLKTEPLNANAWMATRFPYWEGPVRFHGSHSGHGYVEMTGYQ